MSNDSPGRWVSSRDRDNGDAVQAAWVESGGGHASSENQEVLRPYPVNDVLFVPEYKPRTG